MKQKLFTLLLAVAAGIGTISASVVIDGIAYEFDQKELTATVVSGGDYSGSVVIPNSVTYENQTYIVTKMSFAFYYCDNLTSISIPNSVTSISNHIFYGCTNLTTIIWNANPAAFKEQIFNDEWMDLRPQINSFIFGDDVGSIPAYICEGMTQLSSISFGNSVTSIGYRAFYGCSSLTSVTIPNSVTSIGQQAFDGCSSLTSVTIPNSVTSIGDYAFSNCSSLTSVVWNAKNCGHSGDFGSQVLSFVFGNEVEKIPANCCNGMNNLTSVTIPNSVTSIGNNAFTGCSGLTFVTIPNSVTSIGNNAFRGCSGLTSIIVESGNTVYDSRNNCNAIIETATNTLVAGCKNTTIPNSVTSIGGWAFDGCTGLTSVTIPNSVTSIGNYAFVGCTGLTSMTIPNSVTSIGDGAFSHCSGLTSVAIGNNITSIGGWSFYNCSNLTSVIWNAKNCTDFTSTSTPFYYNVFYNNSPSYHNFDIRSQIKTFVFGDSVEHIPAYLCSGMANLKGLTIGSSITAISTDDFSGCNNIKNVTLNSNAVANKNYDSSSNLTTIFGTQVEEYIIGEGVTAIGNYAMHNSSSLQNITLPSSLISIGQRAFDACPQLKQVAINSNAMMSTAYSPSNNFSTIFGSQVQTYNLGDAITSIGDYVFYGNNLSTVIMSENITQIGNSAFLNCAGLTSATIPNSVTNIGNDAFRECTGIETLTLPNVTTIGKGAFADCSNLTAVQLGNGLITLGDSAFSSCYNLQAIAFPSTLKTIGNYAFYQCNHFTAIDIPASITFLGDGAFKGCTKLTTVSINSNAVMSKTYSSTSNLSTIFGSQVQSFTLSDVVTAIGEYAFYNCTSLPTITIPSNVTKIGGSAFYGCTGLKSMIIPENITSIENNTFHGCTALSSINLPNTITSINDSAFFNCSSLQLESLPSSVATLGKGAFSGCGSLASIAIPAPLTSVGENAFNDCSGIAEVKIEDLDSWCKIDFGNSKSNPVFYSRNLYIGDSLIAELTIPNKITELKPWTFVNCNSINSVFIPNTVRLFSPNAFYDCENIASVEWHAKNIADYASSAASPFYASRSKITSFVFGEETEHIPSHLCNGMSKINLLSFPSYLKSIGDYSFKDLTKIRKINIPNEVTSIGAHAFDSCILVTSIYLGYQVEEIGDYAFKGCIRVNDITCMNTVTPVVYDNTLTSISQYAYLYIPAGSMRTYQLDPYWSRFDIREIASEDATLTKGSVTVEANDDNAIFTWPTDSAAASYSLQITKDGVVFCTLVFNSNGQLTGIAFAPSRNGSAHAPAATMSVAGMSFTVTGLNVASKYAYRLAVADDASEELIAYRGEFATTGYTGEVNPGGNPEGIEDVFTDEHKASKILHNGQIFILLGEKVYSITGQEVQ